MEMQPLLALRLFPACVGLTHGPFSCVFLELQRWLGRWFQNNAFSLPVIGQSIPPHMGCHEASRSQLNTWSRSEERKSDVGASCRIICSGQSTTASSCLSLCLIASPHFRFRDTVVMCFHRLCSLKFTFKIRQGVLLLVLDVSNIFPSMFPVGQHKNFEKPLHPCSLNVTYAK